MSAKDAETEEGAGGFKVKDRRRFDAEGNERGEPARPNGGAPRPQESAPGGRGVPQGGGRPVEEPAARQVAAPDPVEGQDEGQFDEAPVTFSSFIVSLAHQALWQLGAVPPPPGMDIPVDRVAAKQTIDILSLLEEKTKGNLDPMEARLVQEVLHELRINFVKMR